MSFHRTGTSLGIQVAGGNAVGIFANAIKDGSPAQIAGLRVGDQVLSVSTIGRTGGGTVMGNTGGVSS